MSFKYSAFIENTPEAREWLEGIGYKVKQFESTDTLIETKTSGKAYTQIGCAKEFDEIDCTNNLPLFKALTAIRDDSDYMQWFTNGVHWYLCETELFEDSELMDIDKGGSDYHKATKEEIIEHFKIKEEIK